VVGGGGGGGVATPTNGVLAKLIRGIEQTYEARIAR